MEVYTDLLPATKSEPHGAMDWVPSGGGGPVAGELRLKGRRDYCRYAVTEFPAGWDGRAFVLGKLDPGTDPAEARYSCFVARNGQDRACECKGFTRFGHCRHTAAVLTLIRNGWI